MTSPRNREPKKPALTVQVTDDGHIANVDLGDEHWCFVVCRSPQTRTVYQLSLCLYQNTSGTWDGMASQNQPKRRVDRPTDVPRAVVIAVFDAVGWPSSPPVKVRRKRACP